MISAGQYCIQSISETGPRRFGLPKPFPMNAWYAAGWDAEIKHALLPRTICGKQVVMYRKANGEVAALEDACWHRLVPLSRGRLDGDTLVCGYHGFKYNAQGRCTFMPSQETINPSACVRAYPVVERHRFRRFPSATSWTRSNCAARWRALRRASPPSAASRCASSSR